MKMKLCSRCKKNIAVVFLTKIENGEVVNDGLCPEMRTSAWHSPGPGCDGQHGHYGRRS